MKCNAGCSYCFMGNVENPFINLTMSSSTVQVLCKVVEDHLNSYEKEGVIITGQLQLLGRKLNQAYSLERRNRKNSVSVTPR